MADRGMTCVPRSCGRGAVAHPAASADDSARPAAASRQRDESACQHGVRGPSGAAADPEIRPRSAWRGSSGSTRTAAITWPRHCASVHRRWLSRSSRTGSRTRSRISTTITASPASPAAIGCHRGPEQQESPSRVHTCTPSTIVPMTRLRPIRRGDNPLAREPTRRIPPTADRLAIQRQRPRYSPTAATMAAISAPTAKRPGRGEKAAHEPTRANWRRSSKTARGRPFS